MRIYELVIDPEREEHIARHGVTLEEAEEVIFGRHHLSSAREGRYRLIGQTDAGRYLTIFLGSRGGGVYGLITARDATEAERRVYQQHRGR
ncbi:MAG: BrnT family toxin [Chloroflexi bacterium]|nr:BrnT family toxin [Chloroflexota bacterium]